MKKIYKLRYAHYMQSCVVYDIVNICSTSEYAAISSIIRAHSDVDDLISVDVLDVIDFVEID